MGWRETIAKTIARREYPVAPRGEWHGDANYANTGGRMTTMSPQDYLKQARPMEVDDVARENIDLLKQHMEQGGTLDPLALYNKTSPKGQLLEDGRHRAHAAQELGIEQVPVINWRPEGM